jgi:hypothetical protein
MDIPKVVLVVPNTKEGLNTLKELVHITMEHNMFIKIVSKKEFNLLVKGNTKGAKNA